MVAILRGPATGTGNYVIFSRDGDAQVEAGEHRFYVEAETQITSVVVSAGEEPVGSDLIVDVLSNAFDGGSSLYDSDATRPRVLDGAHVGMTGPPDVSIVAAGTYLTVDIVAVGDSVPGAKIDVRVMYQ